MNHPKEPYNRLFDRFNSRFAQLAEQLGFTFELRAGPNLGRTLRLSGDPLKRGAFLELKHHWSKSDPIDPIVTVGYGAWYRPKQATFPLYVLTKIFYDGKLSELDDATATSKLKLACAEVKAVSQEKVIQEGKVFSDWPKDPSEAGSYYE
jgi:hypothetical protein